MFPPVYFDNTDKVAKSVYCPENKNVSTAICNREKSTALFLYQASSGFRSMCSLSVPSIRGLSRGFNVPEKGVCLLCVYWV